MTNPMFICPGALRKIEQHGLTEYLKRAVAKYDDPATQLIGAQTVNLGPRSVVSLRYSAKQQKVFVNNCRPTKFDIFITKHGMERIHQRLDGDAGSVIRAVKQAWLDNSFTRKAPDWASCTANTHASPDSLYVRYGDAVLVVSKRDKPGACYVLVTVLVRTNSEKRTGIKQKLRKATPGARTR